MPKALDSKICARQARTQKRNKEKDRRKWKFPTYLLPLLIGKVPQRLEVGPDNPVEGLDDSAKYTASKNEIASDGAAPDRRLKANDSAYDGFKLASIFAHSSQRIEPPLAVAYQNNPAPDV